MHILAQKGDNISDSVKMVLGVAVKKAGILDFRFHDLRHTFAGHYVMSGGSIEALQKILGQKNVSMTLRYAHLSKEFARNEIERLPYLTDDVDRMSAGQVTSDAQGAKDNAKLLKP